MKKKLFFLCRGTNDFERFIAIIDKLGDKFESTVFYTEPTFRLVNRNLIKVLDCNCTFIDLSSVSKWDFAHQFFIKQARKHKSKLFYSIAMRCKDKCNEGAVDYASIILDKHSPDICFFCVTPHDIPVPIFRELMGELNKRSIPRLIVNTGIGIFGSEYTGREKALENAYFSCDYFCASGKDEVYNFYFPDKIFKEAPKACLAMGDPKNSKQFITKLLKLNKTKFIHTNPREKSIAIFGSNLPMFGDVEEQDLALLRIVKWIFGLNRGLTPLVKFHPNTSHNKVKQEIIDLGVHIIPNEVNSIELLNSVDYFISPPTTVMFEAFILNKRILIVDDLDDRPFDCAKLGFPFTKSNMLSNVNFDQVKEVSNASIVSKHIWGELDQEDCRENYVMLLDRLLSPQLESNETYEALLVKQK